MFEFHTDKETYFKIQEQNCREYMIPFIEEKYPLYDGCRVLDIGCGDGGVLKAFLDRGCYGVGVELDKPRLAQTAIRMKTQIEEGMLKLISSNIYDVEPEKEFGQLFDIIVLKDVIEHIHNQEKLIARLRSFLKPKGVIFFGFPPWQMPFGGHQQMNTHKWLSRLPYYHLLPSPVYRWLLKKYNGPVNDLMEIRETGISIERFERIVKRTGYTTAHKIHYLINPIYEYKFGWKVRKQSPLITAIPYLRNYFTTCVYYLITPDSN